MRTTVTLDADVEHRLREAMRRQGTSFKQTINDALRRGLAGEAGGRGDEPFVVESRPLGLRVGLDLSRLRELDEDLEVQEFIQKTARLSAHKR